MFQWDADRLRIWGSHCSGCGTQYSRFSFPNAAGLAGYVIQSGDRLFFRQYQGVGRGGMELTFTDGTSTTGLVNDQDGIPINADTSTGVWKYRRVDLSSFAGKTVSDVALWVDSVTVGSWEIYYDWISLISTDGTVGPIYDRQKTVSLTVAGPAGSSRNYQVNHWSGPASQTAADSYFHGDHLGSARLMTSHGGYQLWQATYLPYGQELNPQTTINRFKFTGKERDNESGLDYFGARYHSSTIGRFTTPDEFTGGPVDVFGASPAPSGPLPYANITNPQSLNKYTYTLNNPLRYVDPDGHDSEEVKDFLLGSVRGFASSISFGAVGAPKASDSDASRFGQFFGSGVAGTLGGITSNTGKGVAVVGLAAEAPSLGTSTVVVVTGAGAAVVGTTIEIGAAVNLARLVTAPVQSRAGDFAPSKREGAIKQNAEGSGGPNKCEECGQELVRAKNEKGRTPPANQLHVHHDPAISKGGGKHSTPRVLCRDCHEKIHGDQ